ncbi:MAG: nuclear transport factor 2 family protein [Aureispira sp.]
MTNTIEKFYTAFQQLDAQSMVACYHDDVEFEDPAFGLLKGEDAKDMWRMLCANAKDFKLEFSAIQQNGETGKAHWEARYIFSRTGRSVHNIIDATFELKDGLIIKHHDQFNLRRWAGQALGFKGSLLGGTKFFQNKLQAQTNGLLTKYQATQKRS